MATFDVERWVDAPAGEVWALVIDLDVSQQAIGAVDRVELVSGPYPVLGVGTTWDETRRSRTERLTCTAIDHEAMRYTVESQSGGTHYTTVMAVHAEGEGRTRLTMSFTPDPRSLPARIMHATVGRLFAGAIARALRRDLDDLARAVDRDVGPDG